MVWISVSGPGGTREASPIQLDLEVIQKRAQELLTEAEQTISKEEAATGAESHEKTENEELSHDKQRREREKRTSKKPGWLKEFVLYARS